MNTVYCECEDRMVDPTMCGGCPEMKLREEARCEAAGDASLRAWAEDEQAKRHKAEEQRTEARAEVERLTAALRCIATDERVESLNMARTIAEANLGMSKQNGGKWTQCPKCGNLTSRPSDGKCVSCGIVGMSKPTDEEVIAAALAFYEEWLTDTINVEGGFVGWHGFLNVMGKYMKGRNEPR